MDPLHKNMNLIVEDTFSVGLSKKSFYVVENKTLIVRKGLGALYLRMCPNRCLTTNLAWHDEGKIIIG